MLPENTEAVKTATITEAPPTSMPKMNSRMMSSNPYIAAAQVAGNFLKKNKKPIIITTVVTFSLLFGRKGIKKLRANIAERDAGSNIHTQQAMQLRDAIKQWGGSTKDTIINMAKQGMDIEKVAKKYRRLYNRSLYDDLRKKFNTKQYSEFMSLVREKRKSVTNIPASSDSYTDPKIKGKMVVIKNATKAFYNPGKYPVGYIKTIPENSILGGVATGGIIEFRNYLRKTKWAIVLVVGEHFYHTIFLNYNDIAFISKYESSYNYEKFTDKQFENLRHGKVIESTPRRKR